MPSRRTAPAVCAEHGAAGPVPILLGTGFDRITAWTIQNKVVTITTTTELSEQHLASIAQDEFACPTSVVYAIAMRAVQRGRHSHNDYKSARELHRVDYNTLQSRFDLVDRLSDATPHAVNRHCRQRHHLRSHTSDLRDSQDYVPS